MISSTEVGSHDPYIKLSDNALTAADITSSLENGRETLQSSHEPVKVTGKMSPP